MSFIQEDFDYKDLYQENDYLKSCLKYFIDSAHVAFVDEDLTRFSKRTCSELLTLMRQAESQPPQLKAFDHWGRKVDEIITHPAWTELHKISAEEGLVSIAYERTTQADSRVHQFLKLMLFHPSSAFYSCPLAMTDGAARVFELEGGSLKDQYLKHLISRDPNEFWTAGQWMTERRGGSDVSMSETYAENDGSSYKLHGIKWFTSAITSELAMSLAQTEVDGKKRLSLFLLPVRNQDGSLNNIEVLRLKDKLGTKALPTAELKLNGSQAYLVGKPGQGVKTISTILNISRLYNAACATGTIYRLYSLLVDYSKKRYAFGKHLIDHPLHRRTLLQQQANAKACVQLVCQMSKYLGLCETGHDSSSDQAMLRFFTPITKLWTAKVAVSSVSEMIEAFGGAGYIEDTDLPRFFRDVQVFSIWEGTTNILSLDSLRAISKETVFSNVKSELDSLLSSLPSFEHTDRINRNLEACFKWLSQEDSKVLESGAREFSLCMGESFAAILLFRFAQQSKKEEDLVIAQEFARSLSTPDYKTTYQDNIQF